VRYPALLLLLTLPLAAAETQITEKQIIGQTAKGTHIEASIIGAGGRTVVLVGGLAGKDASSAAVERAAKEFEGRADTARPYRLIAIPVANPDAGKPVFPPTGAAYRENTESHVLWRWLGVHAPDLVLVAGADAGLTGALSSNSAALMGKIPARAFEAALPASADESEAHRELTRRLARTPRQMALEIAPFYGHNFDQVTYINAVALIAQLRLGNLEEVKRLAEPWASGAKDPLARPNSTALPGFLLFAELAERTGDARYTALVRKTANLAFTETGEMKESMPYHDEMSDSVFMGTPILARAGKLTGERRYYDMAERHLVFMQRLDERGDGLYRHTPLTEAAWGRGNAFPALGLAFTLSDMLREHRAWAGMLSEFQHHMQALSRRQDRDGLWHEVIDEPGSWAEFTATAMIGYSMMRGIRNGWLDRAEFQPLVDKAWAAINARTGADGKLVDVCESTGKMKSLAEYLNRTAILDVDTRGGAMAMLFATEMAGLK
jgi:rhamnogalacturonyl hydrolase YesR